MNRRNFIQALTGTAIAAATRNLLKIEPAPTITPTRLVGIDVAIPGSEVTTFIIDPHPLRYTVERGIWVRTEDPTQSIIRPVGYKDEPRYRYERVSYRDDLHWPTPREQEAEQDFRAMRPNPARARAPYEGLPPFLLLKRKPQEITDELAKSFVFPSHPFHKLPEVEVTGPSSDEQDCLRGALLGCKAITYPEATTTACPACGSDSTTRAHHQATFALPETSYDVCEDCGHQWNHQ